MQNVSTVFGKQKLSTEYAVWVFLNRYLGDEMPALATDLVHPPRPIPPPPHPPHPPHNELLSLIVHIKKKLPIKEKSNSNLLKSS